MDFLNDDVLADLSGRNFKIKIMKDIDPIDGGRLEYLYTNEISGMGCLIIKIINNEGIVWDISNNISNGISLEYVRKEATFLACVIIWNFTEPIIGDLAVILTDNINTNNIFFIRFQSEDGWSGHAECDRYDINSRVHHGLNPEIPQILPITRISVGMRVDTNILKGG